MDEEVLKEGRKRIWRNRDMAKYKLTKTEESEGDKHFYRIECVDEWDDTLVSWDYKKLDEIVSKLNVGEEYIIRL
jgi:hypothetical protein